MSNVENDLSPPLPFYLGASSVKDYLVLRPYYHKLITICSFCTFLSLAERKCFPLYYQISLIIYIPSCGLNIIVVQEKAAFLPSRCPYNSQYLIFNFWEFLVTYSNEKTDYVKDHECTYILTQAILFLHLYQDTCCDFKSTLIRTSDFSCFLCWRKYVYY